MKKQLLIAAVAATMGTAAMADVSITGASKFNVKDSVTSYSTDIMIAGKAGDTTANYKLKLTSGGFETETATVSTSVAGVNVKVGAWKSGANELDHESPAAVNRFNLSTTMGGVKVAVEADAADSSMDVSVSGTIAGVSIAHKENSNDSSETTIGASFGGVDFSVNREEAANGDQNTATTVSTSIDGISLKYVNIDSDTTTVTDGYVGNTTLTEGSAFGISTSVGGNTVTLKAIEIDGVDNTKVVITRPLNGATFEATYDDNAESLDLELAVKF
jgi:hypothetical protein